MVIERWRLPTLRPSPEHERAIDPSRQVAIGAAWVVTPDWFRGPRRGERLREAVALTHADRWTPEQVRGDGTNRASGENWMAFP